MKQNTNLTTAFTPTLLCFLRETYDVIPQPRSIALHICQVENAFVPAN